jgi:hypothetical protein
MAKITLGEKLIVAREARGWSAHEAAGRMNGVHAHTLRTLEGRNTKRDPVTANLRLGTVLELVRVYYPALNLADFAETQFKLVIGR